MKRFEYKTIMMETKGLLGGKIVQEEFERELNQMGADGWDLVEIVASNQETGKTRYLMGVFKREA